MDVAYGRQWNIMVFSVNYHTDVLLEIWTLFLGNNYYCWITNPVAMAIFFVVPVVLMLLFNIVALVRVLVSVRRVRKVSNLKCFKSQASCS